MPLRISVAEVLEERTLLSALSPICDLFEGGDAGSDLEKFVASTDGQDAFAEFQFNDGSRWRETATNDQAFDLLQGHATTITWSIAEDGTFIDSFGRGPSAGSELISFLDTNIGAGNGSSDLTQRPWFSIFDEAFDRWSDVSGINYVYEANDDSVSFSSLNDGVIGTRADVRIGGRFIDGQSGSNTLAFNFFPGFGEMVIDTGNTSFYSNSANNYLRFRNVLEHEAGHGLGFSHVESNGSQFLMEPFISTAFDGPQFDDILAAHRGYGDINEFGAGNDSAANAVSLGHIADEQIVTVGKDAPDMVIAATDVDFVSIDDDSDIDFYRFTVGAGSAVTLNLTPLGPTYNEGPQGGSQSLFDSSAQSDLTLELIGPDGSTVLATSNSGGLMQSEAIDSFSLTTAGDFYIRITGAQNTVQFYQLDVSVDALSPVVDLAIAAVDADRVEGNLGTTPFEFTITRNGDTSGATSVDYQVSGPVEFQTDANDFGGILPGGTVTFAAGETSKTVIIGVSGDTDIETDETFAVTLLNASGTAQIITASAVGTIRNDDVSLAIATVDLDSADRVEGNLGTTPFEFTITRNGDTSGATSVDYQVSGSSSNPTDANDFGGILPGGTVTFAAGETSKMVTIGVSGDTDIEADETFAVTLSNASGAAQIITASAVGTIRNDDVSVDLAIAAVDADRVEGNLGTTPFEFTITRNGDTSGATSVDYQVSGPVEFQTNANDFGGILPGGTVTFAAGETSKTVIIGVSGDTDIETDETFAVTLLNASGTAQIITASAVGTIRNDDVSLAIATVDLDSADRVEGNLGTTPFEFTITRNGDTSGATSVDYQVVGSSSNPTDANDFGGILPGGTVTFAAGETRKTVIIGVSGDTDIEADETFAVTLSNASGAAQIITASAVGTIRNDDVSLAIAAVDADRVEGNLGTTPFEFTITRNGDTSGATSVDYQVVGSSSNPTDANDFGGILPGGTVTFAAGETSKMVTIGVSGDTDIEADETFAVTLSNASGATQIITASAVGTIRNDDVSLAIAAVDADRVEGNLGTTPFEFTITRNGDTSGATSVDYQVVGSSSNPTDANDFGGILPGGTVTFAAGETSKMVTIGVSGDTDIEADETFAVTLSNASGATQIITASAVGTIRNDDALESGNVELAIAVSDATRVEGSPEGTTPFTFLVTRSGETSGFTCVDYRITGSGIHAANAVDFGGTLPSGTVFFGVGQTQKLVTVNVNADTAVEFDEQFTVKLSNPSSGATIIADSADGLIRNDDSGVALIDGTLLVVGTSGQDYIFVNRHAWYYTAYTYTYNTRASTLSYFHIWDVNQIEIAALGGDDSVRVSGRVNISTTIDGGSGRDRLYGGGGKDLIRGGTGNDYIHGGRGADILLGDAGNDILIGGRGRDILVGGLGRDWIIGRGGQDILIGGTTAFDSDNDALNAIRQEWTSHSSYLSRISNLRNGTGAYLDGTALQVGATVFNDAARDRMIGGSGLDWYLGNSLYASHDIIWKRYYEIADLV